MNECKVIAIANQKGGVGKTTTALNLGTGLVMSGNRVLILDSDPQGSLTLSCGIRSPDELEFTLANIMRSVVADESFQSDAGIIKHKEGAFIVPANIELSGVETGLVNIINREYVLKQYSVIIPHALKRRYVADLPCTKYCTGFVYRSVCSTKNPYNFRDCKGFSLTFNNTGL